jgi:mono/diheme cytochrome c family protein
MQLRAGEVLTCNGCHVPAGAQTPPVISHGRRGLTASVNPGAPTTGQPFPNTNAALFANMGETMAEVRARISCQTGCAAQLPSVNVIYDDVWTDPVAAGRPADTSFSYLYSQLTTPAPLSASSGSCPSGWTMLCRIVINYPIHLQPLWTLPRLTLDAGGAVIADRTCVSCHSPTDAAGAVRVPAGQLDLTGGPSTDEADHVVSYRELLFTDNAQEVNMGALQDTLVPVDPSMSAAGARASMAFFSRFDAGGTHAGWLTPGELRLIAEWLDIGGQYYNDPFMAPVN